jgi:hypothetical protein
MKVFPTSKENRAPMNEHIPLHERSATYLGETVRKFGRIFDRFATWTAANARSFSYLLPDSLELVLYLSLAAYFAIQVGEQARLT